MIVSFHHQSNYVTNGIFCFFINYMCYLWVLQQSVTAGRHQTIITKWESFDKNLTQICHHVNLLFLNSLPCDKILVSSNIKVFADKKVNVAQNLICLWFYAASTVF